MHKYHQIRWMRFAPLLFVATGLPLMFNVIPPNPIYGVRTAATLASADSWYHANFWGGLAAVVLGVGGTASNQLADRAQSLTLDQKMWVIVLMPLAIALGTAAVGLMVD